MRQILFALTFLLLLAFAPASAQTKPAPIVASPSQQQEMKPLLEAQKKATADYQAAVTKAEAIFNVDPAVKKAREAFNLAVKTEKAAYEAANNKVEDKAFQIMAKNQLSSREYRPVIEGEELVFPKIEKKDNGNAQVSSTGAAADKPNN